MADDDDDQDLNVDDVDDADTDDADEDFEPPKTKAELDEIVRKAGSAEAAKWRRRATGKDPKWTLNGEKPRENDSTAGKSKGDDDKLTPEQIRAAAREELQAEFDAKAGKDNLRAEVSVALMTAGLNLSDEVLASPSKARQAVARVVNMIDLDNVTLDDGKLEGLDEELDKLKRDTPGLFKPAGQKSGKPRTSGGDIGRKPEGKGAPAGVDSDVWALQKAWFSS